MNFPGSRIDVRRKESLEAIRYTKSEKTSYDLHAWSTRFVHGGSNPEGASSCQIGLGTNTPWGSLGRHLRGKGNEGSATPTFSRGVKKTLLRRVKGRGQEIKDPFEEFGEGTRKRSHRYGWTRKCRKSLGTHPIMEVLTRTEIRNSKVEGCRRRTVVHSTQKIECWMTEVKKETYDGVSVHWVLNRLAQ